MSAITGIFYRDGRKVESELIKKMNDRLSHRGHDGSAVYCDGPVALGHQMLWTTPESLHEKLPFHDEKAGLVLTADARIDNRKELSEKLDIENKEDVSDSDFILKTYEEWGEKCPEHLLGDFAFTIWDENKEKLFCARDHMGVKPFYYFINDEMFAFATEIKALFCIPKIPRKLNEQKAAFYLMDIDDNQSTFYDNILACLSAHSITINESKVKLNKYWVLDPELNIQMESDADYARAYRKIFADAVKCRLRSAFPIGFELSGGLDSSSVVCMAKKILNENKSSKTNTIDTFSHISDDFPESDERYYINKVVDAGGINAQFILCDDVNLTDNMATILWHQEQPFFTPFIGVLWKLYKMVQKNNKRIVLGGLGGDAVVSYGTYYLRDLAVNFKWKKLGSEIYQYSNNTNIEFFNLFRNEVLFPLIPDYIKKQRNHRNIKYNILNKKFADRINIEKYLENLYWKPIRETKTAKKFHHHLLSTDNIYMIEMLDRTTSFFSLEPRYPFLDKRLVEFCYAIPTDMKFKSGWDRYISRVAMTDILPEENQWRPSKASLDPLYKRNFLLYEKDLINDGVFQSNKINQYSNVDKLKNIYHKFEEGKVGYDSFYIWFATLFYLWLQENDIYH